MKRFKYQSFSPSDMPKTLISTIYEGGATDVAIIKFSPDKVILIGVDKSDPERKTTLKKAIGTLNGRPLTGGQTSDPIIVRLGYKRKMGEVSQYSPPAPVALSSCCLYIYIHLCHRMVRLAEVAEDQIKKEKTIIQ